MGVTWESPDGGEWWLEAAHFPVPVSRLFADILDAAFEGGVAGARQWGIARDTMRWAQINGYLYVGARGEGTQGDPELAARAVRERRWVTEADHWFNEEKPAAVAVNRRLQSVAVASLPDDTLREHVREALEHLTNVAPLHFSHRGREVVRAKLRDRAQAEGIDESVLAAAMAGGSPASSRPAQMIGAIADALRAAGRDPGGVRSLDDVRAVPEARAALDEYLEEFGNRLLDSYDLSCPTLNERPDVVVASIRAAATPRPPLPEPSLPPMSDELRQLLAEARVSYGIEDDDDGICLFWPSGLLRRALLELGGRLGLDDPSDVFEVDRAELADLLEGRGPSPAVLAERAAFRRTAASLAPPAQLGGLAPAAETTAPVDGQLRGEGIGVAVVRGRACVVRGAGDALDELEPGDVLIAVTTTPGYNAVMPIVAAVATETHMGHTVICARELGIPAVVGVAGLVDAVPHGALVEVDAGAGTVRVVG